MPDAGARLGHLATRRSGQPLLEAILATRAKTVVSSTTADEAAALLQGHARPEHAAREVEDGHQGGQLPQDRALLGEHREGPAVGAAR